MRFSLLKAEKESFGFKHVTQRSNFVLVVTCVRRRNDHPPGSGMVWVKRTMNSCSLSVEKGNSSCHLVFWSL